jgi:hypothetical protein
MDYAVGFFAGLVVGAALWHYRKAIEKKLEQWLMRSK